MVVVRGAPVYRYYPPLPYPLRGHELHRDHDNRMHYLCNHRYRLHAEHDLDNRVSGSTNSVSGLVSVDELSVWWWWGYTVLYPIPPPHQGHHLLQHNHDNRMHNLCDAGYRLHAEYDLDNRVSGSHQLCEVDWSQVIRSL